MRGKIYHKVEFLSSSLQHPEYYGFLCQLYQPNAQIFNVQIQLFRDTYTHTQMDGTYLSSNRCIFGDKNVYVQIYT